MDLDNQEKTAECENHLAFAYWRTGEFEEAEAWISEAFSRQLPVSSDSRLHSHLIRSLIDLSCKRYEENVRNGERFMPAFQSFGDAFLIGSFCTNIGLSLKNLGKASEALDHLELAKHYHQKSRHKVYLGTVENNLAQLYKESRKFIRAHGAIDNATRLFRQLKDKTREGFSLDTKATIYLAEGNYEVALRTVEKALVTLGETENSAYQVETLLTKARILLGLNQFSDAVLCLSKAINITELQAGEAAARRLISEFEAALRLKSDRPAEKASEDGLELVVPESIGHYSEYRGVWIKNSRLTAAGLDKGSLAIVVKDEVERGDLVAVMETETAEVICGFYDAYFGIVCVEGGEGEPVIFDEKDVEVLGKIVGVCDSGKREDGKMKVKALGL
jgi:tetratricopeptide (TPR) repeat protein